jgi:hypothetical protein
MVFTSKYHEQEEVCCLSYFDLCGIYIVVGSPLRAADYHANMRILGAFVFNLSNFKRANFNG